MSGGPVPTTPITAGTRGTAGVEHSDGRAALTDRPGLFEHDPVYGTSYVYRGNVTKSVSPSNDNLATSYTYSPFLAPISITALGAAASVEYDYYGLPKKSISPYGAATTYVYDNPNRLVTATTGTRIERTTVDGLGRTVKTETGDASGMQSVVETEYGPCACSPLGRVKRVSRPYKPGETVYWTEYAYDTLGRTTRVYLPGGSGTVVYDFLGNTATITDPAGKWKKYTTDAMGNLKQVTESAPEGGTHETYYTYNVLADDAGEDAAGDGDADADVQLRSGDGAADERGEPGERDGELHLQCRRHAAAQDGREGPEGGVQLRFVSADQTETGVREQWGRGHLQSSELRLGPGRKHGLLGAAGVGGPGEA